MAIEDTTGLWRERLSPALEDIETLARDAYAQLPDGFRELTGDVVIVVADFPDDDVLDALGLESPFDLLGLFEGRQVAEKWNPVSGEFPNRITLYRRPMLDYWADHDDTLGEIVTHVLIHEIGHHFGLSDDDMAHIEASAGMS